MDDYLAKPVTREQLLATLARWIPQTPQTPASEAATLAPAVASRPAPAQPIVAGIASSAAPAAMPPLSNQFIRGPAIDREVTEELREVMGDDFRALVKVFLEDAPNHLAQLEAAALGADLAAMAGPAHALKSASANLGAGMLSDLARAIEIGRATV